MNISPNNAKKLLASSITAVVAAVSSTLCCIGPLIYLAFGISSPWLMELSTYAYLRLPMLVLSLTAFAYGFWLLIFSKKIICTQYFSRRTLIYAYGFVFVWIAFFLSYPSLLPLILESIE